MLRYVSGKVFYMLVSLFILATATFFLMKAIPGDPFMSEKAVPPEIKERLYEYYGLDQPLLTQYKDYLGKLVQGDLGMSMKKQHQTVSGIIKESFGYSLRLGIIAIIVSVIVGVALGTIAALYHLKLIDSLAMVVAVLGVSVPNFVLASLMQYYFGLKLGWFNVSGLAEPLDYVMPVMALSALPIAFIARLTRSTMLEVLHADYIKTAKAKGISPWSITVRHALRNAVLPVVTYLGPLSANIITGSVVVEKIFGIAGLGKFFIEHIGIRDYSVIMGITLFYGMILMLARLTTDIAYGFIDPRIKMSLRKGKA